MQQKTKKSDPQATFPPHPRYKSVINLVNTFVEHIGIEPTTSSLRLL